MRFATGDGEPAKRRPGSLFQPALSAFQPIASHATQLVRIRRRETPLTTRPHHARARATRARGRALTFAGSGTNIATMASYATIPAEAEAEKPLLNRDLRVNLKTVIGGAAVASFVLGALAAAVVSGAPRR